jgi:hypothetical protein
MKNVLILCALLCVGTLAQAQFRFGPKAGINYTAIYGSPQEHQGETLESIKFGLGYQLGAFAEMSINDRLGLMVELAYEAKRSEKTAIYPAAASIPAGALGNFTIRGVVNSKTDYSYINLPVLATFGNEKFKAYFGPSFGFLLGAKSDLSQINSRINPANPVTGAALTDAELVALGVSQATLNTIDAGAGVGVTINQKVDFLGKNDNGLINDTDYSSDPYFNQFELGLNLGGMLNVTDNLFLDLRINYGITDRTNNKYDVSVIDLTTARSDSDKTAGVLLSLGYRF